MLLKCYTKYVCQFGKLSSAIRTGKGQFSFQSQRRVMPKNVQTTTQLHSFHMLVKKCTKSFKLGFSSMWTVNFQMCKLDLEGRGTRDQIANICWIIEKAREFQKNIYFCCTDYTKAFNCVDHNHDKTCQNCRPNSDLSFWLSWNVMVKKTTKIKRCMIF